DDSIAIVGMNRIGPAIADCPHLRETGVVVPAWIGVGNPAVGIGKPEDLRSELEQVLELRSSGNAPALELCRGDGERQQHDADDGDGHSETEGAEHEPFPRFPVDRAGSKTRRSRAGELDAEKSQSEK